MATNSNSICISCFPDEILLNIFSYIESRQLINSLSLVCKRFRYLLTSEWFWKRRYRDNYNNTSPWWGNDDEGGLVLLMRGSVQCDDLKRLSATDNIITLKTSSVCIDSVCIIHPQLSGTESIIVGGGRDHSIYLWRKRNSESTQITDRPMREYIKADMYGHKGWVWCLARNHDNPNILCSGSWDKDVRIWDIRLQQCMNTISKQHKGPVLSMSFPEPTLLITGCNDKLIRSFDFRDLNSNTVCGHHTRAVLGVVSDGNNSIYSCSEDKMVKLWDKRKPDEIVTQYEGSSAVTNVCYNEGILSVSVGKTVSFLTPQLEHISSYTTDHSHLITSLYHNLGMIVTGSRDNIQLTTTSTPHTVLRRKAQDVTYVDYSNKGLLAVSSSDGITLWSP